MTTITTSTTTEILVWCYTDSSLLQCCCVHHLSVAGELTNVMQKRTTTTIKGHQVENVSAKTRAFESNQKLWFPKQKTVASPSAFPSICCWSTIQHVKHNEDLHTYWPLVVGLYLKTQRDRRENIYTHTTMRCFTVNWRWIPSRIRQIRVIASRWEDRIPSKQSVTNNKLYFFPSIHHLLSFLRCADDDVPYGQLRCDVRSDPLNSIVILSRLKTSDQYGDGDGI